MTDVTEILAAWQRAAAIAPIAIAAIVAVILCCVYMRARAESE